MIKTLNGLIAACLLFGMTSISFAQDTESSDDDIWGSDSDDAGYSDETTTDDVVADESAKTEMAPAEAASVTTSQTLRSYAGRGIVMPEFYARGDVALPFALNHKQAMDNLAVAFSFGVAFSPLENLEVGLSRGRQQLMRQGLGGGGLIGAVFAPNASYGDMNLYGRYRFLEGDLQLGADVNILIPTSNGGFAAFGFSVPGRYKTGSLAIDFAPTFRIGTPSGGSWLEFGTPLEFAYDISENLYAAVWTGLNGLVIDTGGGSLFAGTIPLMAAGGYTAEFMEGNLKIDFEVYAGLGDFVRFGDLPGDAVDPDVIAFGFAVRGYFDVNSALN